MKDTIINDNIVSDPAQGLYINFRDECWTILYEIYISRI